MSEFKLGDLVEFIPENFDYPHYSFRLIGIGFIDRVTDNSEYYKSDNIYRIYCGKIIKQQMKNFAEIELKDQVFIFTEDEMRVLCRKINSK